MTESFDDKESLSQSDIAEMLYPELKKKHISPEEVQSVIDFLHGSKALQEAYESAKESGTNIELAEQFADKHGIPLDQAIDFLDTTYSDNDSDEFYLNRVIDYILADAIGGIKHLDESDTVKFSDITLENWLSQLEDELFEEIKVKNPRLYPIAKKRSLQILLSIALTKELDLPGQFPQKVAATGTVEDELKQLFEIMTKKANKDTEFNFFGLIQNKATKILEGKLGREISQNEADIIMNEVRASLRQRLGSDQDK